MFEWGPVEQINGCTWSTSAEQGKFLTYQSILDSIGYTTHRPLMAEKGLYCKRCKAHIRPFASSAYAEAFFLLLFVGVLASIDMWWPVPAYSFISAHLGHDCFVSRDFETKHLYWQIYLLHEPALLLLMHWSKKSKIRCGVGRNLRHSGAVSRGYQRLCAGLFAAVFLPLPRPCLTEISLPADFWEGLNNRDPPPCCAGHSLPQIGTVLLSCFVWWLLICSYGSWVNILNEH